METDGSIEREVQQAFESSRPEKSMQSLDVPTCASKYEDDPRLYFVESILPFLNVDQHTANPDFEFLYWLEYTQLAQCVAKLTLFEVRDLEKLVIDYVMPNDPVQPTKDVIVAKSKWAHLHLPLAIHDSEWAMFVRYCFPHSSYTGYPTVGSVATEWGGDSYTPAQYNILFKSGLWHVPRTAPEACLHIVGLGIEHPYHEALVRLFPELAWVICSSYDNFTIAKLLCRLNHFWNNNQLELQQEMETTSNPVRLQVYPFYTNDRDFGPLKKSKSSFYQDLWKWKLHSTYLERLCESWQSVRIPIVTDVTEPVKTCIGHATQFRSDGCFSVQVELLPDVAHKDLAEAWFRTAACPIIDRLCVSSDDHAKIWNEAWRNEWDTILPRFVRVPELHSIVFGLLK